MLEIPHARDGCMQQSPKIKPYFPDNDAPPRCLWCGLLLPDGSYHEKERDGSPSDCEVALGRLRKRLTAMLELLALNRNPLSWEQMAGMLVMEMRSFKA